MIIASWPRNSYQKLINSNGLLHGSISNISNMIFQSNNGNMSNIGNTGNTGNIQNTGNSILHYNNPNT